MKIRVRCEVCGLEVAMDVIDPRAAAKPFQCPDCLAGIRPEGDASEADVEPVVEIEDISADGATVAGKVRF